MHSRIFQIAVKSIPDDGFLSDSDLIDSGFIGSVADYIGTDNDRDEDIQNLRSSLEAAKVIEYDEITESFTLLPNGKENYFAKQYDEFINARDKTLFMGISDFVSFNDLSDQVRRMADAFDDKFGYCVSFDGLGIVSFDYFIRSAEVGMRYFIGSVLDYHY